MLTDTHDAVTDLQQEIEKRQGKNRRKAKNVDNIEQNETDSADDGDEKKRPPIARYYQAMAKAIALNPEAPWMSGFPERFHVVLKKRRRTVLQVVDETDGVCVLHEDKDSELDAIEGAIQRFCTTRLRFADCYQWTPAQCHAAAKHWRQDADLIEMPADVLFKGESGLTFHRLPFERNCRGAFPVWLELLSRMQDPDWAARHAAGENPPILENKAAHAFCLFFGSLMDFDPTASRAQYLWMHGEGGDSKSDIASVLHNLFGPAARSLETPDTTDSKRFFTSQLIGARVGVFSDVDNAEFTTSALWKKVTGDRIAPIEPKGKTSYSAEMKARFVFMSQHKPNISSKKADMRRIIYVPIAPFEGVQRDDYYDRLWAQTGPFLSWCMGLWARLRATGTSTIVGHNEAIREHVESIVEGEYTDFIESTFKLDCPIGFDPKKFWARAAYVNEKIRLRWPRRREQQAFKDYFKRVHGRTQINTTVVDRHGNKFNGWVYPNMQLLVTAP